MQFKEIIAPSMKELFIKNIEQMILSGQLAIGDKLPPERELAAQMKVSRTIVNTGLTELSKKGFIEVMPRSGAYVADYIKCGNLETLLSIVNHNGGRPEWSTLLAICEFRITLEGRAYELAAINRTQEDLETLFGLLQKVRSCSDHSELSEYIFQFHHAVFCASKNLIYPLVHTGLEMTSKKITNMLFEKSPSDFAVKGIELLYEKIKLQDSQGAKESITSVINQGLTYLREENHHAFY